MDGELTAAKGIIAVIYDSNGKKMILYSLRRMWLVKFEVVSTCQTSCSKLE